MTAAVRSPEAPSSPVALTLSDDAATARVGAAIGRALRPGDSVLLEGGLGAGKSALARAAILARLADGGRREEAPSPTFTLVQTYEAGGVELWHADLYRLSDWEEAAELGLGEAFERAICLVEWPDRLGPLRPARALTARLAFPARGEGRRLELAPEGGGWDRALDAARAAA